MTNQIAGTLVTRGKRNPKKWTRNFWRTPLRQRRPLPQSLLRVARQRPHLQALRPPQLLRAARPQLLRGPRLRQLRAARRPLHRPTHHRLLRLLHNLPRSRLCCINCEGLTNNLVKSPVCRVADVITDSVLLLSFDHTLLDVCFGQILC